MILLFDMKIKLKTKHGNRYAIIDCEDYDKVNRLRWYWLKYNNKPEGYAFTNQLGKTMVRMHRFIMNAKKGQIVDHINGDSLDNRKCNLRFCTARQNQANMRVNKENHSSKYRGVYWNKKKWIVCISTNSKNKHYGCFDSEKTATKKADEIRKILFGKFAYLNLERR